MSGYNVSVMKRFERLDYTPNYNRLDRYVGRRLGTDPEWIAIEGLHGMLMRNDFVLRIKVRRKEMQLRLLDYRSDMSERQFYDGKVTVNYGRHRDPTTCSKLRRDFEDEVAMEVARATGMYPYPAGCLEPDRAVIAGVVLFGKVWQTRGTVILP